MPGVMVKNFALVDSVKHINMVNKDFQVNQPRDIIYCGTKILNRDQPILRYGETMNGCMYCISDKIKRFKNPFLMFFLIKQNEGLSFPQKQYTGGIPSAEMKTAYEDYMQDSEFVYQGYIRNNHVVTMMYQLLSQEPHEVKLVQYDSEFMFVLIDEIVNWKKMLSFDISDTVVNLFLNNPQLIYLCKSGKNIEVPIVAYSGEHKNAILLETVIGKRRELQLASLGPYYYFSTYGNAMRHAIWNSSSTTDKNDILDNTGRHTAGGIVRYALFLGRHNMFLGRNTDLDDTSKNSKNFLHTPFIKFRDSDGKWAKEYDSIGTVGMKLTNDGIVTIIRPKYIVKDYKQQVPISFHYVNTHQNVNKSTAENAIIE